MTSPRPPRASPDDEAPAIVLALSDARAGWIQRLADLELWSDRPWLPNARSAPRPASVPPAAAGELGALVYDGPGSVGGRLERVRGWLDAGGFRTVEFERGERFRVSPRGERIEQLGGVEAPSTPEAELRRLELAVGAPLALALALHEIVLLHAAALERAGAVLALVGPSGAGKSTLAAAGARRRGWRRAADDILPVRADRLAAALPAYPQLKLTPAEAWPAEAPIRLPLTALIELDRFDAAAAPAPVELVRVDPARGAETWIRATVAARLFDETLLRWHFDRVTRAAARVPVWRLRYPNGRDGLGAALDRLERLVEELAIRPEIS